MAYYSAFTELFRLISLPEDAPDFHKFPQQSPSPQLDHGALLFVLQKLLLYEEIKYVNKCVCLERNVCIVMKIRRNCPIIKVCLSYWL